jgi:hypothetical protein
MRKIIKMEKLNFFKNLKFNFENKFFYIELNLFIKKRDFFFFC